MCEIDHAKRRMRCISDSVSVQGNSRLKEHLELTFTEHGFDTVVVRFGGEIGVKAAWTRKLYERRLIVNIKAVLKHHAIPYTEFVRKFGRLFVKTLHANEAAEKLRKIFGVSSLSPALETTSDLNDILDASVSLAGSKFKNGNRFAVRCRRVGRHPYMSQDICRLVGQSILDRLSELHLQVNLTNPDHTVSIEIRDDKAYLFTDIIEGVGGLPLGTQPKLIGLLNGDESSAAACWMTMKRGSPAMLVYFAHDEFANKLRLEKAMRHAQSLMNWAIHYPRKLQVIECQESFQRLGQGYSSELSDILFKRLMLRIAKRIAESENAEGIVTGDTLGKNWSREALNALRIQDEAGQGYPIYRPLIGLDICEIGEIAQRISLDKMAISEFDEAPTINIDLEEVRQIEQESQIVKMVENALKSIKPLPI